MRLTAFALGSEIRKVYGQLGIAMRHDPEQVGKSIDSGTTQSGAGPAEKGCVSSVLLRALPLSGDLGVSLRPELPVLTGLPRGDSPLV